MRASVSGRVEKASKPSSSDSLGSGADAAAERVASVTKSERRFLDVVRAGGERGEWIAGGAGAG